MEILQLKNLSFEYPGSAVKALDGVDVSVRQGEFLLICGASGCGKTTLLRLMKREIAPYGKKTGEILYKGEPLESLEPSLAASRIGFVAQNPDEQIVTDKVWHELAFGLENLGVESNKIRRRVAETASFFGIHNWYRKNTYELSDGQKQILNLASVMVMQPEILLLDEPTSRLDPIAAGEFIAALQKLNRELGLTVIIVEHRLEELFPVADRVLAMENGRVLLEGAPRSVSEGLKGHPLEAGLPCAVRIFNALSAGGECPMTVREGRDYLENNFSAACGASVPLKKETKKETVLEAKGVCFKYGKNTAEVVSELDFKAGRGEVVTILGGNGSGKTTTLNILAGLEKPYKGKVKLSGKKLTDFKGSSLYSGKLAYLPQNPKSLFIKETVGGDFEDVLSTLGAPDPKAEAVEAAKRFGVEHILNMHPYDLSGGEIQKCAICLLMLSHPQVVLLDEPTKGIDAAGKLMLANLIAELKAEEKTVVAVTHDIEFAALVSDRCAMLFDGRIISEGAPREFFSGNNYYTTAASRISRGLFGGAVLCGDVVDCCRGCVE